MPRRKPQPRKPAARSPAGPLEAYGRKRDFHRTPEPAGVGVEGGGRTFVVQEHHARSHHFDFRLEIDGVLVSWAVPKGVPEDPSAKRLAVHVEDHPLEYGQFEGEIPKGNYGAGKVSIWDRGEWEPEGSDWRREFAKGKLKFTLRGERLSGSYVLFRMGEEPNWILRKLAPLAEEHREEKETLGFIAPQLARLVSTVPSGEGWMHEIKFDGYRLIAVQRKGEVRLFTRSGLDWTERFGPLAGHLGRVTRKDFVFDGEAVVFDEMGRSSFGHLQAALQQGGDDIVFMAFDLLNADGRSLRELPLSTRLERLAEWIDDDVAGPVRRSRTWPAAAGRDLLRQACAMGLEGVISKRADMPYASGSRRDWAKTKCRQRQEFVICGYTAPRGSLPGFGALVLGSYENGRLVPRGKVGTGFSDAERQRLVRVFQPLRTDDPPLRYPGKDIQWLSPHLVAEVEFAEITRDGSVRQASFSGLREDKPSVDVHLETMHSGEMQTEDALVSGIQVTHPDRVVYPDDGVTKLDVARYYERLGEHILAFARDRPLALLRAPEGLGGDTFFQKSFNKGLPDGVRQRELDDGTAVLTVRDVAGLVSLAQHGTLEFHLWGASFPRVDRPDVLVWDLDPDEAVPWKEVQGAALLLRDFLAERGLSSVVKTSGGKGLHILMRVKRMHGWETMKPFTKAVAGAVAELNPRRFTIQAAKAKRTGRIYIDWLRNGRGATCVAPWCLRARRGATVSMPIRWDQLSEITADAYTIHSAPEFPKEWRDLKPQTIPKSLLGDLGVI